MWKNVELAISTAEVWKHCVERILHCKDENLKFINFQFKKFAFFAWKEFFITDRIWFFFVSLARAEKAFSENYLHTFWWKFMMQYLIRTLKFFLHEAQRWPKEALHLSLMVIKKGAFNSGATFNLNLKKRKLLRFNPPRLPLHPFYS